MTGEFESGVEAFEDELVVTGERIESSLGVVSLALDPGHLALEQIEGNSPRVVGLEQPLTFVVQLGEFALLACLVCFGLGGFVFQQLSHDPSELLGVGRIELDPLVGVFDCSDCLVDRDGFLFAGAGVALSSETDEVGIDPATSPPGVGHAKSGTAGATPDRALEIVLVDPGLLPRLVVGIEHCLDLIPRCLIHQGWVVARIPDTAVADFAQVVAVAEQPVQMRQRNRSGRTPSRWGSLEASFGQFCEEPSESPFTGGVGLEGPTDMGCPFGVDGHCADFTAAFDGSDVQIPQRCFAGCATRAGFLGHAFGDFVGQVPGVELGDGAHDPVQQLAAGCFVDAFGAADQLHSSLLKLQVDQHVVLTRPSQPIDLVDDHKVRSKLGRCGQQPLEFRSISGAS